MRKIQSQGGNETHFEKRSDDSVQLNVKEDSTMLSCFTLPIVGTTDNQKHSMDLQTLSLSNWVSNPVFVRG